MDATEVRFFGGPADGRLMVVNRLDIQMVLPPKVTAWKALADDEPIGPSLRQIHYRMEWVAYRLHPGLDYNEWPVMIADGYPMHRITDQMNAIAALSFCRWYWGDTFASR